MYETTLKYGEGLRSDGGSGRDVTWFSMSCRLGASSVDVSVCLY